MRARCPGSQGGRAAIAAAGSGRVKKMRTEQGRLALVIRKFPLFMRTVSVNDAVEGKFIYQMIRR